MTNEYTKFSEKLLPGETGVVQTLNLMKRLALRDADTEQVKRLIKTLKGKTQLETIKNIYEFVTTHWEYKSDPKWEEHVTAPIHVLNNCYTREECKHIDCDDFTTLLACLYTAAGFDVAFRVIAWRIDSFTHVYLMIRLPEYKGWTALDAVMGKDGLWNEKKYTAHKRRLDVPLKPDTFGLNDEAEEEENYDTLMDNKNNSAFAPVIDVITGKAKITDVAKDEAVKFCQEQAHDYIQDKKYFIMGAIVTSFFIGMTLEHFRKKVKFR